MCSILRNQSLASSCIFFLLFSSREFSAIKSSSRWRSPSHSRWIFFFAASISSREIFVSSNPFLVVSNYKQKHSFKKYTFINIKFLIPNTSFLNLKLVIQQLASHSCKVILCNTSQNITRILLVLHRHIAVDNTFNHFITFCSHKPINPLKIPQIHPSGAQYPYR